MTIQLTIVHAKVTVYYVILIRLQPLCDLMIDYFCATLRIFLFFLLSL